MLELLSAAFEKTNPKAITQVPAGEKGSAMNLTMSNGMKREGMYHNTTRNDGDQAYTYMWKWQCAFTKWTPSNQYYVEKPTTDFTAANSEITLERFGFIGHDKKCYWGLFGVMWIKPLPVWQ